ncbi:hypothetical protein C5Y93_02615 [Blastopirellula marina]|uniref:Serine protease n=2 Tax=Blastopirellula marina TaxID=124 RepID=A0A2S8GT22_9BACT|nr:hypothetical protein C5Y93_02615 [Blastopirellula marina]
MVVRLAVGLVIVLASLCSVRSLAAAEQPARWKSVCLIKTVIEREGKQNVRSSSAFFVKRGEQVYLTTARHSSEESLPTSLVLFSIGDKSFNLKLSELGLAPGNDWLTKPNYDLAVLPVAHKLLSEVACIDLEDCRRDLPPPKTAVEAVGFPLALGALGPDLSPIVIEGKLASGELTDPFKSDGQRMAVCVPAIAEGTSGAPLFGDEGDEKWRVIGIITGNLADGSGGKLGKFVPAHAMIDLIEVDAAASEKK